MKRCTKALAWAVGDFLGPKIVAGLKCIRPVEARIIRHQAALIAWLMEGKRYQRAGQGDRVAFTLEMLQISASTAKQRRSLDRILRASPVAEKAFLEGRLSQCKVLALKPILLDVPERAAEWVERARELSVAELQRQVRDEMRERKAQQAAEKGKEEAETKTEPALDAQAQPEVDSAIVFSAPANVHFALDQVLELGRLHLGYDAPAYQVIEAILAETGFAGKGTVAEEKPETPREPPPIILDGDPQVSSEVVARTVKDLEQLEEFLKLLDAVSSAGPPADAFEALGQLDQLADMERPLRCFQGRLLRDFRQTRAVYVLGYGCVRDFVEHELGLSERSARDRVADAEMFEDFPKLMEAYLHDGLSLGKAHRIRSLTNGHNVEVFCRRAVEVTHRHLHREYRFLLHLRQCFPDLASRFRGPLPHPGLDEALIEALRQEGWTGDEIELALLAHDVEPIADGASRDPAENPMMMHRLEQLLHLLIVAHWEDPPEVEEHLPPRERQTSGQRQAWDGGQTFDDRQTFGHRETFGLRRGPVYVRIAAPRALVADWDAAIEEIRRRLGPFARVYQAAVVLFAAGYREWSHLDPGRKPAWWKIMKRDRFACQAPGCPKKGELHGHHLTFRSEGGTDDADNLVTLCYADHQDEVHAGYTKVTGEAPQRLEWDVGCRPGEEPLLRFRGDRIVGGSRAPRGIGGGSRSPPGIERGSRAPEQQPPGRGAGAATSLSEPGT